MLKCHRLLHLLHDLCVWILVNYVEVDRLLVEPLAESLARQPWYTRCAMVEWEQESW